MAEKPKQGDYKTTQGWAVALRNWRAAQQGSEVAADYTPEGETVVVGRKATKPRRLRAGSVAETQRARAAAAEAAKPKGHTSPRGEAVRKVLSDGRKKKAATPTPSPTPAATPSPTPEMGTKMKAYHSKWLAWDKKERPGASDSDRSARFDALRQKNAAKKKE